MAYDGRPEAELALQFINGNKSDAMESIINEGVTKGIHSAVSLSVSVYKELRERGYEEEAEMFAHYLRTNMPDSTHEQLPHPINRRQS